MDGQLGERQPVQQQAAGQGHREGKHGELHRHHGGADVAADGDAALPGRGPHGEAGGHRHVLPDGAVHEDGRGEEGGLLGGADHEREGAVPPRDGVTRHGPQGQAQEHAGGRRPVVDLPARHREEDLRGRHDHPEWRRHDAHAHWRRGRGLNHQQPHREQARPQGLAYSLYICTKKGSH